MTSQRIGTTFALILAAITAACTAGNALMSLIDGEWKPTRIEMADDWYLVGIRTDDLQEMRVRI